MITGHARCVLSRVRSNGHSLLLSSYLSRIGRIENSSCSACGHLSQDISHLILHCPATESVCCSLFCGFLSFCHLWSRSWVVARLVGSMVFHHAPIPRKGSNNNINSRKVDKNNDLAKYLYVCQIFLFSKFKFAVNGTFCFKLWLAIQKITCILPNPFCFQLSKFLILSLVCV